MSKVDTIITSRCSLPCPHCSMYTGYCRNRTDYPLKALCDNFDVAFSVVDYVMEYCLFGGEPLIYKELVTLIEYLMSNYGSRIGRLVLISNGNARLTNEICEVLKKYNVMISVSDYTHKYNYKETQNALIKKLKEYSIEYSFNRELVWKDTGYPDNPMNVPDELAKNHFKACGHSCFSINNKTLYYCDSLFGAEVNTQYKTKKR